MFYEVSKALAFATIPSTWAVALLGVGAAAILRRRLAVALALLVAAVAVLAASTSPAIADDLQRWVESSAVTTMRPGVVYDAVIVVGSGPDDARVHGARDVLRSGAARAFLYSGRLDDGAVRRLTANLRAWGVPEDRSVIEARSRNTHENAVESARIARARGWSSVLIVTSATHVERALGCYRAAGLDPDVLVVDRRAPPADAETARADAGTARAPARSPLRRCSELMHEVIGRVVYRAVGYAR